MSSATGFPKHEISLEVEGAKITGFSTYEIETSMLENADRFHVSIPFEREVWDLVLPDREVRVKIDDVTIIRGFIDERLIPEGDEVIEILGRCRRGRLVDESCPSFNFSGLELFELVKRAADPWFTNIVPTNARNRKVIRGRGKKARAGGEPLKLNTGKKIGTRIEPGQTRAQVITELCKEAGYLWWTSGDGNELIIGRPNYDQEPQFEFTLPKSGADGATSTVMGIGIRHAVTERYSRVIVVGSGQGTDANYGASVASRYGDAKNNPATTDGEGRDFLRPKRLIVVRSVGSIAGARELAQREMAQRDAHAFALTVLAQGHGQVVGGSQPTIFVPDTQSLVSDERTDVDGLWLIVGCTYRSARDGAEQTSMQLVRSGSELVST